MSKKTKKKVLVTGAAGFIGSHIAHRCIKDGYDVYTIDNLLTGSESNIPKIAKFIKGDVGNRAVWGKLPKNFDACFHLAAQSSGEISYERPGYDLKANTLGTLLALHWCKDNNVRKFIFSSSMSAYGDPPKSPVKETTPCNPLSFYGISKLSAEKYIEYFANKGLNTTTFRLFSVYGPGQNLDNMKQGIVSIFLAMLLKNKEIHVKGSGKRFRDLTHVDDVVNVWMLANKKREATGEIFNVGTGKKTLIQDLVKAELLACGLDPKTYPVRYEGNTPDDTWGLYADISKLKRKLGYTPKVKLADGLKQMVKWAKGK